MKRGYYAEGAYIIAELLYHEMVKFKCHEYISLVSIYFIDNFLPRHEKSRKSHIIVRASSYFLVLEENKNKKQKQHFSSRKHNLYKSLLGHFVIFKLAGILVGSLVPLS